MRADGTHVRRLTDSPGLDEGPDFWPDGTKITFSSARDGQQEIYVMDADGSNPRRLTDNPARDESPDWQALPFDGRGHRACGDDSLASGGASSVLAMRVPCHVARRLARRWGAGRRRWLITRAAEEGLACSTTQQPCFDLTVVAVQRGQGAVHTRRGVRVARSRTRSRHAGGWRPRRWSRPSRATRATNNKATRAPPKPTMRSLAR